MKNTISPIVPFSQTQQELVTFINKWLAPESITVDDIKTPELALDLLVKEIENNYKVGSEVLNAQWLSDHFTIEQLHSRGIIISGSYSYKNPLPDAPAYFIFGTANVDVSYTNNDCVKFCFFESTTGELFVTETGYLTVLTFDKSSIKIEAADFVHLSINCKHTSQVNLLAAELVSVNVKQYGNSTTKYSLFDMVTVCSWQTEHSGTKVEYCEHAVRCLFQMAENSDIIINSGSWDFTVSRDGNHEGHVYTDGARIKQILKKK